MIRRVKAAFLAAIRGQVRLLNRATTARALARFAAVTPLGAALLLSGGCAAIKPAAVVANDVARDLCALHYGQREGISLDDAAKTFCQDLRPWLDLVLRAQRDGTPLPNQCGDAGAQ